jgi:hypothetical protein
MKTKIRIYRAGDGHWVAYTIVGKAGETAEVVATVRRTWMEVRRAVGAVPCECESCEPNRGQW